jgi:hypothetical protein
MQPITAHAQGAPARISWARLLKRVFDIDIDHCPNCAGALKIIAAIEDPPVILRILTHLGLPTRAPPRAPARRFDLFQAVCSSSQDRFCNRADDPARRMILAGYRLADLLTRLTHNFD